MVSHLVDSFLSDAYIPEVHGNIYTFEERVGGVDSLFGDFLFWQRCVYAEDVDTIFYKAVDGSFAENMTHPTGSDEHVTIELPTVHDLVNIAYVPIVRLHEPKITLSDDDAHRLKEKMLDIIGYLESRHIYKAKILQMLYAVFLLDVQSAQEKTVDRRRVSQRIEEILIGFIRLLPRHFAEHHDIGFFASSLNISPVYLSRVVRKVTGRTVVDYINRHLLMEASYLLRTTSLSVTQIADRLHFADAPSFSKFFTRNKGITPKDYRKMD